MAIKLYLFVIQEEDWIVLSVSEANKWPNSPAETELLPPVGEQATLRPGCVEIHQATLGECGAERK